VWDIPVTKKEKETLECLDLGELNIEDCFEKYTFTDLFEIKKTNQSDRSALKIQ